MQDPSDRAAGRSAPDAAAGAAYALAAYGLWGVVPVYWKQLGAVPADELTAWRTLWAAAVGLVLVGASGRGGDLARTLRTPRLLLAMALSALLIGANWLVFIYAVHTDRVMHTSLGYYVNPLVTVALAFVILRERLRPAQWLAVGVAAAGVAWWTLRLGGLPWISALLAVSFALYGLMRKLAPLPSVVGFCVEMLLLAPLGAAWLALRPDGSVVWAGSDPGLHLWVAASGLVTAGPLVCFASAAQRLPLAVLGIFQYIAPSLALLLAVAVYAEPFTAHHAVTFGSVAAALVIFSADSLRARAKLALPDVGG